MKLFQKCNVFRILPYKSCLMKVAEMLVLPHAAKGVPGECPLGVSSPAMRQPQL